MKYRYYVSYVVTNELGSATFSHTEILLTKRIKTVNDLNVLVKLIKLAVPEANKIIVLGFTLLKRSWF